ncbi:MAG: FAD-dependent oxidoreductase, partial [Coxiellaceae bacterium]|nr:FAD-dependent oxidoreductase [Coxiellaceae bacterium]
MSDRYDVVIVGGGMIGLSLAAALANANFSVAVIESKAPHLDWSVTDYDARVSAIHLGTQNFLEAISVWSSVRTQCYSPLERMEVWDGLGGGRLCFDAAEISQNVLGYIVENRELVRVLWEYCEEHNHVSLFASTNIERVAKNQVTLSDGDVLVA